MLFGPFGRDHAVFGVKADLPSNHCNGVIFDPKVVLSHYQKAEVREE
jgi:hypothetical protein